MDLAQEAALYLAALPVRAENPRWIPMWFLAAGERTASRAVRRCRSEVMTQFSAPRGSGNIGPRADAVEGAEDLCHLRRIRVLGATGNPVQSWVVQQAGNLLMDLEDAGMSVKFVLHDRDASFTAAFGAVLSSRPGTIHAVARPLSTTVRAEHSPGVSRTG